MWSPYKKRAKACVGISLKVLEGLMNLLGMVTIMKMFNIIAL